MTGNGIPLWQRPELRRAAGETLRPGGLDLTDRAATLAGVAPGWRVLDVGSGLGATVRRLRSRFGVSAYGMDISASQLSDSGRSSWFVRGAGHRLPFQDNVFHAVFCECVLSLFEDRDAGLREFHRVLAPGGVLVVSDLCANGPATGTPGSCAEGALPLHAVRKEMIGNGFTVRREEDHSRLLRELAAGLVFAGGQCLCESRPGLGYFLMIVAKEGENDAE